MYLIQNTGIFNNRYPSYNIIAEAAYIHLPDIQFKFVETHNDILHICIDAPIFHIYY